jgi:hypothetical protein
MSIPAREYFSTRRPREFKEAIEQATADGSIDNWLWSQLLGVIAPPGYSESGRKLEDFPLA